MKQEELIESIYGCLDRIENKVNGLSISQSENGNSEVNNSVNEFSLQELKQDLNAVKTEFKRTSEGLASIKCDTANLLNRASTPDKFVETLSALRNEYRQNRKQQTDSSDKIMEMMSDIKAIQTQETEELKSLLRATDENIKGGIYNESHHSFSIESPFIFWGFSGMFAAIVVLAVALYFVRQPNYERIDNSVFYTIIGMSAVIIISFVMMYQQRETLSSYKDNDLKYRYIKMKGEASPKLIENLENIFELNRDNNKIRQMRKDVKAYEEAVRKRAALAEQARLKEQAAKEQENKATSIKGKPIQSDKLKK